MPDRAIARRWGVFLSPGERGPAGWVGAPEARSTVLQHGATSGLEQTMPGEETEPGMVVDGP